MSPYSIFTFVQFAPLLYHTEGRAEHLVLSRPVQWCTGYTPCGHGVLREAGHRYISSGGVEGGEYRLRDGNLSFNDMS